MRNDGNDGSWRIPEGDRSALVVPPIRDWRAIAETNHQLTAARSLHRQIVAGAVTYTRDVLGEHVQPIDDAKFILATGHQPRFYHPGVWFKNFLVAEAAAKLGAVAVNLIVDTDEAGTIAAAIPVLKGGWQQVKLPLMTAAAQETFEYLVPPEKRNIENFAARLVRATQTGYSPETRANVQRFATLLSDDDLLQAPMSLGLAGWLTKLRRRYEGQTHPYLEFPVSRLSELAKFKEFAAEIINDSPSFTGQYNATLASYRHAHGYRYKVNPFPDLHRDEATGEYELPFWVMVDGARSPVYASINPGQNSLHTGKTSLLSWSGEVTGEMLSEVRLRPRGMTLTLFTRMFGADLFLHGIGGAKYDGATSWFIRDYYHEEPPAYAGATLTLFPHIEGILISATELQELEELIRDVEYNPDRHLASAGLKDHEQQRLFGLVDQKESLISEIKAVGANRKELGLAIKQINRVIGSALDGYRQELTASLTAKRQQYAAVEQVTRRDYSYFLFSPADLARFTDL